MFAIVCPWANFIAKVRRRKMDIGQSTKFERILLNDLEPERTRSGKRGEGGDEMRE